MLLRDFCSEDCAQLWREVFAGLPDGLLVAREQEVHYVNPACARCFGYDDSEAMHGLAVHRLIRPMEGAAAWSEGQPAHPGLGRRRDGREFPLEFTECRLQVKGQLIQVLMVRDTSERRRLDQQYRDAQKMQVVGRLVGGIVHDFNNLLTAVMIYAGMLLGRLREGSRQHHYAQEIERASERGASLAAQLLALARQQPAQPQEIELPEFLRAKRELLQGLVGERVAVKIECAHRVARVLMDPAQLDQVLLNLAANARDAMPQGGSLVLTASNQEVTASMARRHLGLRPGWHVILTVRDNGCGMDEDTRAHLFEPFFTTKERGKGTGLGLTTVYGILAQAGGRIYVDSNPGIGTEVSIFLPAVREQRAASPAEGVCVLLVEDEPLVRDSLQESLVEAGFEVLAAGGGPQAVRLAGENAGRLALLVVDMVMPEMSGREVAERVLEMRPDLPVIYMSGYTAEGQLEQMRAGGATCLQKPFPPQALVEAVQAAMGTGEAALR